MFNIDLSPKTNYQQTGRRTR